MAAGVQKMRLVDGAQGTFPGSVPGGWRTTPPMLELGQMLSASIAVELGQETAQDLASLRGKATSLGGMRPTCSLLDEQGHLALGKFPGVSDERNVTRAEVLALTLARRAGIDAAHAMAVVARLRHPPQAGQGARVQDLVERRHWAHHPPCSTDGASLAVRAEPRAGQRKDLGAWVSTASHRSDLLKHRPEKAALIAEDAARVFGQLEGGLAFPG